MACRSAIALLGLSLLAIVACSCRDVNPQDLYVQHVDRLTFQLTEPGERLGAIIKTWLDGEELDANQARHAISVARLTVLNVSTELEKVPTPENANELASALAKYIDFEIAALDRIEAWLELAAKDNSGTRQKVIDGLIVLDRQEREWKDNLESLKSRTSKLYISPLNAE